MGGYGVRRPGDFLEGEIQPLAFAGVPDIGIDLVGAFWTTELSFDIVLAQHTVAWHVRVQLKGAPLDRYRLSLPRLDGAFQPSLADKAPGADYVREQIDPDHHIALSKTFCRPFDRRVPTRLTCTDAIPCSEHDQGKTTK